MATALIALEGVLRTETGDPIPEGIKLYRLLVDNYRVVITSDLSADLTEHWLRSNLIIGYADIYDSSMAYEGQELRSRQLSVAMNYGIVSLFIDPDADFCAEALSKGITTILFAAPKFVRRSRTVRKWDDMIQEVERQKLALLDAQLGSQIKRYE